MKRKAKPSGTDGRNILILEPHGGKAEVGKQQWRFDNKPGSSVAVLRAFQGLQGWKDQAPNQLTGAGV